MDKGFAPMLLRVLEAIYRKLVTFFPGSFREAFGVELTRTFKEVCHDSYNEGGNQQLAVSGIVEIANLVRSILEAYKDAFLQKLGKERVNYLKVATEAINFPLGIITLMLLSISLVAANSSPYYPSQVDLFFINFYLASFFTSFSLALRFKLLTIKDFGIQGTNSTSIKTKPSGTFLKRFLDLSLVIPVLVFVMPLFLIITIAIKLDSPGPVIYRQRFLGVNGRVFDALKFRTMHVNGDEILARYPRLRTELVRNYKLKCDPRVTRVGDLLRKFSLDELPQLFNVLNQDMSLVGPRIITPDEIVKYGDCGSKLLTVSPGLTGLWQVSGRSSIAYEERVQLDMEYIDNWSIWLDIMILFRTAGTVLPGVGAY